MKRKRITRRAEVTIETEENIVLRAGAEPGPGAHWCPACRRHVEMVTPDQAAHLGGVSPRTVYRWMESGAIHFTEGSTGISICRPSLPIRAAAAGAGSSSGKNELLGRKP